MACLNLGWYFLYSFTSRQYTSPCGPTPSCPSTGGIGCGPGASQHRQRRRRRRQTDKVGNAAMPLDLVAHKLARLGAGFRVDDSARAAEDGPVKGEDPCSLDELGSKSKQQPLVSCRGRPTCSRLSAGPSRGLRPPAVAKVRRDRHGAARERIN